MVEFTEMQTAAPGPDRVAILGQSTVAANRMPVNELLARLTDECLVKVMRHAERISLVGRQVLQERNVALRYVYFIESGVASLLIKAPGDRANVEIRTLGAGDFVGLAIVHRVRASPHRCVVQVAGEALRFDAETLSQLLDDLPEFRAVLSSYAYDAFVHSSQLVACNTRHSLRQRLARWLLVASDRLGSNQIDLTHDGLSRSIAVRRAGVTTEMGRLEQAGLIRRGRGAIVITDRLGLQNISCSCYRFLCGARAARCID